MAAAVEVAVEHRANFLLAEFVGAAVHHRAAIRVTLANVGKTWPGLMAAYQLDFATIDTD